MIKIGGIELTPEALTAWAVALGVLGTAVAAFYVKAVKPFLDGLGELLDKARELIQALRDNTTATNTSADNLATTAAAVTENTVVTKAVADALPAAPVTVNVSQPPAAPGQ